MVIVASTEDTWRLCARMYPTAPFGGDCIRFIKVIVLYTLPRLLNKNDNAFLISFLTDELIRLLPGWFSHLCIQAMAGTLGGFTTTIITNPLDIVRARLQVQRLDSMLSAFRILWIEEGLHMFTKGLSARLVQSACFSFSIILGYETIKRVSITEEYKSYIRWWTSEVLLRLISRGWNKARSICDFLYDCDALFNVRYFSRIEEKPIII